jgi:uncharacterized repeat protein (TIGR03803 family)
MKLPMICTVPTPACVGCVRLVSVVALGALTLLRAQSPVIYSFAGSPDGASPKRSVIVSGTSLYGVTPFGGSGDGTVYELTSSGGSWAESVLYSFAGGTSDGSEPDGNLLLSGGSLYGTTSVGGTSGYGTAFRLKNSSGAWTETVIHNFAGGTGDGSYPYAGLLLSGGVFYGTTYYGGTDGGGTVFSLAPSGLSWTETVLYSFGGSGDGANPHSALTISGSGVLYGTTYNGGASGDGTLFSLTPSGGGSWTEAVLYSFGGSDGLNPHGGVALGSGGVLYGTTLSGGGSGDGVAFSLTPPVSPSTTWTEATLRTFTGGTSDGAQLRAGVLIGSSGVLYGATVEGGSSNAGVIYSLTPPTPPSTTWTESILYNFTGSSGDGSQPYADLVYSGGYLYGTTYAGGTSSDGTVFALVP